MIAPQQVGAFQRQRFGRLAVFKDLETQHGAAIVMGRNSFGGPPTKYCDPVSLAGVQRTIMPKPDLGVEIILPE